MNKFSKTFLYLIVTLTCGVIALLVAIKNFDLALIDLNFILLATITIALGSRITIQVPRFKSHIAVSDVFIFLALFIYGGSAATILAAVEAFFSSWRFCNKKITVFLNTAVMACSTSIVVLVLLLFKINPTEVIGKSDYSSLIPIVSLIAITQYLFNSGLASIYSALISKQPIFETWKTYYLWTSITFFFGAIGAVLLASLIKLAGFLVLFATVPIILIIYSTYRMYMKNVEMSLSQAEQAKKHAEDIETQSIALRESERLYKNASERFQSAFNYAPIGIALVSSQGIWLKVNYELCKILDYTETDLLSMTFHSFVHPNDLGDVLVNLHQIVFGHIPKAQKEVRFINTEGEAVWTLWSASKVGDFDPENQNFIFQIQDITDRKSAEEKLQYEATHDALTNLPNRAYFISKLDAALNKVKFNPQTKVSILFIDLDRFKVINDSLGHQAGDELLIGISKRLRECIRPTDMVARLGGDEFTILVEGRHKQEEVIQIAERIKQKFTEPFQICGHEIFSSSSIGILHSSPSHQTSADLMRDADIAMYQAKRAGKARHEVFEADMQIAAKEALEMENDLRRALENNEIKVYYQPIYSIKDDKIIGFEALARWIHKKYGIISPNKFIPIAEEIGLIDEIGEEVLKQSCIEINKINNYSEDYADLTVSVNVSCKQFSNPFLFDTIQKIIKDSQINPKNLKLEITESVVMEYQAKSIEILNQFTDLGLEIYIDDFGTGYSNLNYLMQLPISTLKIDHSFISKLNGNDMSVEIVDVIIKLAHSLGLKIVAEGVENKQQLEKLADLNCEKFQGNYFSKPLPATKLMNFLAKQKAQKIIPVLPIENVSVVQTIQ
jgi:diguanylate cyclase (GGDEF)-like protein/PAS domain S-box-containing protein